ncbi:MAG: hypothetical protein E7Z91_00910 [Cyanobacteria bacterium SIG30]|nr:hypothetical protein [Cyanobacteria bacterium SIG30]
MKNIIGFIIFCVVIWYGVTNLGWADWLNADSGFVYEVKQLFNKDNVEQLRIERQKRINEMY